MLIFFYEDRVVALKIKGGDHKSEKNEFIFKKSIR